MKYTWQFIAEDDAEDAVRFKGIDGSESVIAHVSYVALDDRFDADGDCSRAFKAQQKSDL